MIFKTSTGRYPMSVRYPTVHTGRKQFTGSEQFYRHGLSRNHIYTEGVQFLAERAQVYWLLDKIALHGSAKIARERFQVWKLTVNPDCSATKNCGTRIFPCEKLRFGPSAMS
jgi:hypothetical protein